MILAQLALGLLPEAAAVGIDNEGISIGDAGPEWAPEGPENSRCRSGWSSRLDASPSPVAIDDHAPPSRCRAPSSLDGQPSRHRFAMATW